MMCSPNQSEFLNASQTVLAPNSNKEMVKVLDYHVSSEYANKVYKSCADVVMPSTSGTVMDILCGPWGGNYKIVINFFLQYGPSASINDVTNFLRNLNPSSPLSSIVQISLME